MLLPAYRTESRTETNLEDMNKEETPEEEILEDEETTPAHEEDEEEVTEDEETDSEEEDEESESEEDTSEDVDYAAELERLENGKANDTENSSRTELDRAKKALFFNAKRIKELGGDPDEVLGKKKKDDVATGTDTEKLLDRKFAERDAKAMARNPDELKLIMWYVDNKGLSVEQAYILANEGRLRRTITEIQRSKVKPSGPSAPGRRVVTTTVPDRSPEEKVLLERRGLRFDPKSKTWKGKYSEEYYDPSTKRWQSRKLQRT